MTKAKQNELKSLWADLRLELLACADDYEPNLAPIEAATEAIGLAIRAAEVVEPPAKPQPLWRPVDVTYSTTSPDNEHPYYSHRPVLVTDGSSITAARCLEGHNPPAWRDYNRALLAFEPTHWAPLPKLPEVEA